MVYAAQGHSAMALGSFSILTQLLHHWIFPCSRLVWKAPFALEISEVDSVVEGTHI